MSYPVLITGGSQRVGLAIANDLLARQIPVIITYRTHKSSVDQLRADGATTVQADFSTDAGITRCIDEIMTITTCLRAVIHNASEWEPETSTSVLPELFDRMMQVHAKTPYMMNMGLQSLLTSRESPTDIIHITDYAQNAGSKNHIAYAASKAAMHNLTLSFARMLAPSVKVNTLAPALLMFNNDDDDDYKKEALSKSLMETEPGAKAAVHAVNYLLESDYVTGETLQVNGGRHLKFRCS